MKKSIYILLGAFLVLCASTSRSKAQVIASHYDMGFCSFALDSMMVTETGYTGADSIIVYNGDGTDDTAIPTWTVGTTAYYSPYHIYGAPGTYSKKIVLISGGVRVDSVTYSYTWDPCEVIQIRLYSDNNSNCAMDAGDTYLYSGGATIKVDSAGVPVDTVTSTWGIYYYAHGPAGTVYTFTVITNPTGFLPTCPSTGVTTVTVSSTFGYYLDSMGFECDPTACLDNAVYSTLSAAITGARANMYLATSSCTPITVTATLTFSPKYTLSSVWGPSYSVSGNVITFTGTVSATSPRYISAVFSPVGTLSLGDTAQFTFETPTLGDCNTANNSVFMVDTLTASYDPNHKTVQPNGAIAAGTQMEYMLEFENTGNGVAHNVHLMDTLSDDLDISTIKQIAASAPVEMILMTWAGHNIVKFDFEGIDLADSTHKPMNQGFVSYTIKVKSSATPGTNVDNKAGIYFDTNPVVMTNNVRSTIPVTTHVGNVNNNVVGVYPNPVNDVLTVNVASGSYNTVTVTNLLGQVVMSNLFTGKQTIVNVKALPAGMYYITLRGESGVKVQKFEKL